MACPLASEKIWSDKNRYCDAEREYYARLTKILTPVRNTTSSEDLKFAPISSAGCQINQNSKKPKNLTTVSMTTPVEQSNVGGTATTPPTANKSKKNKKNNKLAVVTSTAQETVVPPGAQEMLKNQVFIQLPIANNTPTEETKTKKKKKKKNANKDSSEKSQEASQPQQEKQNTPIQPLDETTDSANSAGSANANKKSKATRNKGSNQNTLVSEIAKARQHIKNSLEKMDGIASLAAAPSSCEVLERLSAVEQENSTLQQLIAKLSKTCLESEKRIKSLEDKVASLNINAKAPAAAPKKVADEDDDGVDLFASDSEEESEEAAKIREERVAAYAARKSKKPVLIAKSSLVLDVKPWDDETDLNIMEAEIRKITTDGLLWGASKFLPVAFGIKKLSISCVVEDEKVSIDWLSEEIEKMEDYVQSVDVAAFNKI